MRTRRHAHLEVKTSGGRWLPYCSGAAYATFPKGVPNIFEVMCMEGVLGPSLEEMRDIAVEVYKLEVRIALGVCPTLKKQ